MNSNSSVGSTKYDPDLIKADVILARKRVDRLRHELEQIRAEMQYKQRGLDTLAMYIYIQGPVVQNFVSLMSLLRPQLVVNAGYISKYTVICVSHFINKNNSVFVIFMFEI